jgi:hypothetical protein
MEEQKKCTKCKEFKNLNEFTKNKRTKDGLSWLCKKCRSVSRKAYYIKYKPRLNEISAQWRKNNQQYLKYYNQTHNQGRQRKSRYGIDFNAFQKMLDKQNGECDICHKKFGPTRKAQVDHNHKCCSSPCKSCGKCVRSLLCRACNQGLGKFDENIDTLESAIAYVRKYNV